ncbi:MAG: DUF4417 domain-containing protein [Oscillospiraceae bacterium]|nr:DUF4417 domain-containing protein [Oscillospiraceae bacterium]
MTLENYKYRTNPLFLRNQFSEFSGKLGIPVIPKPNLIPKDLHQLRLLRFDQVKNDHAKHRNRMVHFFLYDYLFEKVWLNPENFVKMLFPYRGLLSPDFSMYIEMPSAIQLYNTFRNRWCGAYFAEKGLRVIPTVSWGEENSFDFCFEGIEKGSAVAVSTYMFHAHGNHADQKELFMAGYREMLRRIELEYIICYSEPFPEMDGNIIYVDYDLSSWKYLEDDIIPPESIKHTHGILITTPKRDIISKTGYVCKGSGSAGGGTWTPKNEDAKRFKGDPNTIKHTKDKNGEDRYTKIGKDGRAIRERHHSVHLRPDKHSNPHDHEITWKGPDQHPEVGPPINYDPENGIPVPDLDAFGNEVKSMNINTYYPSEEIENDHFESISDFKWCVCCGGEVQFLYQGVGYTITHPEGFINISKFYRPDTELESDDIEDILNYLMDDGKKLREVITEVEVTERTI